jgi:hypothetical protein
MPPRTAETDALKLGNNAYAQFVGLYYDNRVAFVEKVFKVTLEDWQKEILEALDSGKQRVAIRSGHGVGKTALLSWVLVHFAVTRYPQKSVCTAPTSAQLFDALAAETKRWFLALPNAFRELFEIQSDRIILKSAPTDSFISFRTSRAESPESLQGVHSKHVLLIADEASGIPEQIFESAGGSMSTKGAITLLTGNPTRINGYFWKCFHKTKDRWFTRKVTCFQSSQVDKEWIQEIADAYGPDSNVYRVRVLGEFPRDDDDTCIPLYLIEDAVARDIKQVDSAPVVWGLDVARFGDDRTVLVKRKGNVILDFPEKWKMLDTMQTVGRIKHAYDTTSRAERPVEILVDVIGIGAGVVDRGRELGLPIVAVNVAESPSVMDSTALRLRDELWLEAKKWFERRDCKIPNDEELILELASVKMQFTSANRIKIESKDQMKKRGLRSPDVADAFILTFGHNASVASGSTEIYRWRTNINERIDTSWIP